jgi:hypothetical protein
MDLSDLKPLLYAWLALPLTALSWWIAWGRLPERVIMKLDAANRPIHWASRVDAMTFDMEFLGGILLFLTLLGVVVAFAQPVKARLVAWLLLGTTGFVGLLLNWVLWHIQVP